MPIINDKNYAMNEFFRNYCKGDYKHKKTSKIKYTYNSISEFGKTALWTAVGAGILTGITYLASLGFARQDELDNKNIQSKYKTTILEDVEKGKDVDEFGNVTIDDKMVE
ncbi:hypothetical protein GF361_05150 [Candidatus Woesearchaeota archaeon]|nr:hypothetical protein [Candidatus Woesearchaeota archaeon]